MPDFSVPDWLKPPSETERQRLKLIEDQVQSKATSMLRKQIGVQRMQQQAKEAVANGVDEPTARKNALLNNAELLFGDNPEALARLQSNEEATAIRERTLAQTQAWHQQQLAQQQRRLDETSAHNSAIESLRGDFLNERSAHNVASEDNAALRRTNDALRTDIARDREARLGTAKEGNLPLSVRQQIAPLNKEIGDLTKKRLAMPTDQHADRFKLAVQAGAIQKQIDQIVADSKKKSSGEAVPTSPKRLKFQDGELVPIE